MTGGSTGDLGDGCEEPPPKSEVIGALMEYLHLLGAGGDIERAAFLAEHAAYVDELRPLLEAIDSIRAIWDDPPDSE